MIAVIGATLVFALSLVVQGLAESFARETTDTLSNSGVGRWFVSDRSTGPFTGFAPIDREQAQQLMAQTPISEMLVVRQPIGTGNDRKDGAVIGVEPGAIGAPLRLSAGRDVKRDGEAVVSARSGADVGSTLVVGGSPLRVVGTVDTTLLGGTTNVYTTLSSAQALVGAGPVVTVLATTAAPAIVPPGLTMMRNADVHRATLQPLQEAIDTIATMRSILWLVASLIVGAMLYLNAIERTRDVAVMKAIGVTSGSIAGSMLLQAALIALISAVLAGATALVVAPTFPMKVAVTPVWLLLLPVFAVTVSCAACSAAVRRALTTSPAVAFGGS